jgi:hypothetical protein
VTPPNLPDLLRLLDVPDAELCRAAGCDTTPLDCNCDEPCDCPVLPPPPCEHVTGRTHGLALSDWAELLEAHRPFDRNDPDCYGEPPAPADFEPVLSREARVAQMSARQTSGRGLRHASRVNEEDLAVGTRAGRYRNGTAYQDGLRLYAPEEDEAPAWDVDEIAGQGIVAERWRAMKRAEQLRRAA